MGDFVLAYDYGAVDEAGGDVMAEIRIDGWDYVDVFWDAGDGGEEVDGGFETPDEETGAGEEEIAYGCGLEIEDARGTGSFYDF